MLLPAHLPVTFNERLRSIPLVHFLRHIFVRYTLTVRWTEPVSYGTGQLVFALWIE